MTNLSRRSALVISSTPPMPRDYGNRNRVHQTTEFVRALGYGISFLLYPFDKDWEKSIPGYYPQLASMFDYFAVIPNSRPLHLNAEGDHHLIDEWWDENLERHIRWLTNRKPFELMLVNYAFFSRAFDFAPRNCAKVMDTHDLFSGRKEMFAKHGVNPEFFYTTPEQEKIAFDRADVVIAIKDSEAEHIRKQTKSHVVSLPYWDGFAKPVERPPLPAEFTHERPLRVGFIGAQNSVNSVNLTRFLAKFAPYVRLYDLPIEVVIAGNVCEQIWTDHPFVRKLGRVAEIGDFYGAIDAVVAPLEFSTGIKIKVAEAMAWGVPVVATANAFDGFRPFHTLQAGASVAGICEILTGLATHEIALAELVDAGISSARAAVRAQDRGFADLRKWIKRNTKRNVVATTRPFWRRRTFVDEQLAQATELMSQVARTIVLISADEPPQMERLYTEVDFVRAPQQEWAKLCNEIGAFGLISALMVADGARALESADIEVTKYWRLDARRGLARPNSGPHAVADLDSSPPSSLLRYAPFGSAKTLDPTRVAIVSSLAGSEWDEAAAELAAALCAERDLTPNWIRVDHDGIRDEAFFGAVISETASRWLLVGPGIWTGFLQQMAVYRGAVCMLVRIDLLAPQIIDEHGRPSLMASVSAFLDGASTAGPASGADTGWSKVWT